MQLTLTVKTKEQLLASGWEAEGNVIRHPTADFYFVRSMLTLLGSTFTVDVPHENWSSISHFGWGWSREMFVDPDMPEPQSVVPKQKKTNPFIKQFARADLLTTRGMIRCGFELETQSTEGYTNEDSFDEEAYYDAVREAASELEDDLRDVLHRHINCRFLESLDHDDFYAVMEALGIDSLESLCGYAGASYDSVRGELEDRAREDIDSDDYKTGGLSEISIPDNMVGGYDQSVSGFEFATSGARTYAEFIRAASDIFQLDHEIDTGCSFHIHLSVVGIDHQPGALLTKRMTEYILDRQDQLPESVRERFAADNKFYRPRLDPHEKFAFVRRHPEYKTWEFRCFGNVTNARDAKICLDMAIAALKYAYECKLSNVRMPGDQVYDADWVELARDAMRENRSLTELLTARDERAA